jgi:hypothetical protein
MMWESSFENVEFHRAQAEASKEISKYPEK